MASSHSAHKDDKKRIAQRVKTLAWTVISWPFVCIVTFAFATYVCNGIPIFTNPNVICIQISKQALQTLIEWILAGEIVGFSMTLIPLGKGVIKIIFNHSTNDS